MKKRFLSAFIVLCILSTFFNVGVSATTSRNALTVSALVDGAEISSVDVEGETYLFLPADADIGDLSLCFKKNGFETESVILSGENGTINLTEEIDLRNIASRDRYGRYVFSAESEGARERIYIMKGDGLPTLYLYSDNAEKNRKWVDKSKKNEATGSMLLLDEEGESIYDGDISQIKARGNSTFYHYSKKSYQIKLDKKTDLLGNGEKVKTWVLLANYGDATLIHDKFFKDLAAELGMDYTPSCGWVNLYYDGEYRGVYLLSEKVSVGGTAVDITDMEEAYDEINKDYGDDEKTAEGVNAHGQKYQYTVGLIEPENITGGYLIEMNRDYLDEVSGFFTAQGVAFNVKSPEWAGQEAMKYISEYYQDFENAVYATDEYGNYTGYNAETGKYYYEYCDLDSLVQTYLILQQGLNVDSYIASLFFYKDVDGIMYAGPIWDMDLTCGTGWAEEIAPSREFISKYRYLSVALSQIPHFRAAVEDYYSRTFAPTVRRLLSDSGTIDAYISALSSNAVMNYQLWPYVRVGDPANESHLWTEGTNYKTVTNDMKGWLTARLNVLDKKFKIKVYDDVTTADWEYEAVRFTTSNGIFNGVSDSLFASDESATRGMICTVLARMAGEGTTPADGENWMQPGLDWAVANGISDGTNPEAAITREQIATMLYRYVGEPLTEGNLDAFTDGESVSDWAENAVKWAVTEEIFKGDGSGMLNPTTTATRAEIAQVIMNFMTK